MKRLLFLFSLFFTLCFFYNAFAQELRIVRLDQDDGLFAIPSRIVLSPGDSLKFISINGDFDIYIVDAVNIFQIKVPDLKIRINSSTDPESDIYVVRETDSNADRWYSIYCITKNAWPDAPPRIIIVSE